MARVTLSQAGEDVIVGGADVQVIGTSAGGEVITVVSGNVRLDPSFNAGGDTIVLPGNASDYTAYRTGGEVIFTRNDGGVTLRIPIGAAGTEIQFNGGDSRTLLFNSTTGQATLEGQALGTSSTSPTPITAAPGGPAPVTGYTISAADTSVVEGENGTRLLVYTITLSKAVTAADGPLTLNYQTQDGTASSASDYVAAAGQVTFAVGQQVATVAVVVNGDVTPESNETLSLRITGGTLLNNQPVTLTGTIINDDAAVALTGNADNFTGSASNDGFFAANGQLGAGDKITDASTTDNDTLTVSLDGANTLQNVGGFALTNVETLAVTNDDTDIVTFDLSSSKGIQTVGSVNSSNTVVFNQVTSAAGVLIDDVTGPGADVVVIYQDQVLTGATTINVTVNDANFDDVVLAGVTTGTTGIENVVLNVSGTSTIDTLVTDLQSLTIQGGGNVKLDDALNTTIRTINATNAGSVNVNFSNNDAAAQAVTFTGSAGNDTVLAGLAADIISGGAGNDTITNEGGNDVINGGAGDDLIVQQAAGDVTIDAGTGTDTIRFDTASLDLNDKVTFDGTAGDTLAVSQGVVEGNLVGVNGATNLTVLVNGTTDLGQDGTKSTVDLTTLAEGQRAGIQVVNLNLLGTGGSNDILLADDYTVGLTVNLGAVAGTDRVELGTGNDTVRTASFDNTDVLLGNKGVDAIVVNDGANSVTAGNFVGFETVTYLSDADGDDQTLIVNNANAPTDNGLLTVDASALVNIPAVPATSTTPAVAAIVETLTFDSTAVSAFKVDVTGGAAADSINTNNTVADTVRGLGGADVIVAGGADTVDGGAGKDAITLFAGDNIARGGDDEDTITIAAGAGNNTVLGEGGNDRIEIVASADLTKLDTIDGGAGTDTIAVAGTFVDAQFTGVFSVEVLEARAGAVSNVTIGAEAQEGGIRTVNLLDGGADVLNASAYTADLTVTSAGGDDNITTGSGSDTINLGVGINTIVTGAGNDRILASGTTELDFADTIKAGAGSDTIVLDNSDVVGVDVVSDTVVASVNLGRFDGSTTGVSGVENFTILANGESDDGKAADVNNNVLTIGSTNGDVFDEVTVLNVDASALTDQDDSFRLVIDSNLADDDVAFKITGSSTTTIVEKLNLGIDNNINFIGGTGADILRINGADAGSTVTFNGTVAGADDQILQTGGVLSDDGFVSLSGVEVLTADAGLLNATLGNEADEAGINRIIGTTGNDKVTLAAGFNNTLTVVLDTGADTINGAASSAAITFIGGANLIQADDTLSGGSTAGDVITLNEGNSSNLSGVSQVETINVVNSTATVGQFTTITLDATAAEVNGRITINASTGAGDALVVNATNNVSTGAGAAAGIIVNGGSGADLIQTGGGNDTVNSGDGADQIRLGAGNDTANGGAAVDTIRGELGDDTLNGDAGNDLLYGDFIFTDGVTLAGYIALGGGNDTLNGGEGNDTLVGGLGRDTLTGGLGADNFRYQSTDDSRFFPGGVDNRDRITDFNRAEGDKIDLSGLTEANGQTIRFNGNYATFGEAQSAISSTAGGGFLDAVYVQESDTLYVDVNNDGVLNGDDLQIILQDAPSTFTLVGADINAGAVVGAAPVVVMAEMDMMVVDHRSLGMNTYDSVSFA